MGEAPASPILDEYKRVEIDNDYDIASAEPIGSVIAVFLHEIAATIRKAARTASLKVVKRT